MDQPDVVKEFQRRRKDYFKKSIPPLGLMAVGFLPFIFLKYKINDISPIIPVLALIVAGAGIIWETQLTQRIYRCPVCDVVPMRGWVYGVRMTYSRGVYLNPEKCPTCGERLK
jgi:hypothetical protein